MSLAQLKVMSAIESCRTAALGGHVARCEDCAHTVISYNSCRNRHCPKCQGAAARTWMEEREAELLPVPYFHIVFTKAVIYDLLFKTSAETMLTIAADAKHLGARIAITFKRPDQVHCEDALHDRGGKCSEQRICVGALREVVGRQR